MNPIKVVDARMGRGKSTAAINYINANRRDKRFIYITPLLSEVARFRDMCALSEPQSDEERHAKSIELRALIHQGKSISTTHQLYELINDDILDVIREKKYTLVIDETITAVEKVAVTPKDRVLLDQLITVDENGMVSWNDDEYIGKFSDYKKMADRHILYNVDSTLVTTFNYNLLTSFEEVFILTYLFQGSMLEACFRCFNIPYEIWGVEDKDGAMIFLPGSDSPPPADYRSLIRIVDNDKMNEIGETKYSLTKNWYRTHSHHDPDVIQLRKNMQNFFKNMTKSKKSNRLWTCFVDHKEKLIPDDGSYADNFLQMNARGTNEFAGCFNVAYMVNRYQDPNLMKFLTNYGCGIDNDMCALSDMLQWIWRSSIRLNNSINLYIPSRRMRELLIEWIDRTAVGESMALSSAQQCEPEGGVSVG